MPKSWLKKKRFGSPAKIELPKDYVQVEKKPRRVWRIPHFLFIKRLIAAVLLIINFFVSQAALISSPASQPMWIFFVLNFFILLDYLWKTRKVPKIEK